MLVAPPAPAAPPLDKAHAGLRKATQQFEAYFLDTLLKEMRKTVPKDSLLGDEDNQEEIFRDMQDQNLADSLSQRGDLGLGKELYDSLSPTLEATKTQASVDIRR